MKQHKPVAYRWNSNLGYFYDIYDYGNGEPLYTTSQIKDLTDEEIEDVADQFKEGEHWKQEFKWSIPEEDFVKFARAILRKAQEK